MHGVTRMSAQDKLGIGMLTFLVFFLIAFLLLPREVYQKYFANLKSRGRSRMVGALAAVVFALSLPYFYELLVGFDNRGAARVLQLLIGAAAYLVLIDAAVFAYKNYWIPSFEKRRRK
jgi:hypothetical protein